MMEFIKPKVLTVHYTIATPMFLGGENQQADKDQCRNASLKGALRFWWRALNWGRVLKAAPQGNQAAALKALHDEEGRLFGLASDGKNSCHSLFSVESTLQGVSLHPPAMALQSVGYLLGQGLFKNGVLRSWLEGGSITVQLAFKSNATTAHVQSVRQAAIALGLFGGLGSRARKGLGSLSVRTITGVDGSTQTFTTLDAIRQFIAQLDFSAAGQPPLSALSAGTRIEVSDQTSSALKALEVINNEMQLYRSYGRNGKVGHQPARRNFVDDHDRVLRAIQDPHGHALQALPRRAVFGLPHNYFYSSPSTQNAKADINPSDEGRRASPLLVHIHALEDAQFAAIQTLLPTVFLPSGMTVDVKTKSTQRLNNTAVDYAVIGRYMDGFKNLINLKKV